MWILNLGKPVNIAVLNEEMAIELGANLLGESIIFVIAAVVLLMEYNRSARKEAAKEAAKIKEIEIINTNMRELFMKTEEQGAQIKHLLRVVTELESGVVKKPWIQKKKPDEENDKSSVLSSTKNNLPAGFIPIPVPSLEEAGIHSPKVESSIPSFKGLALKPSLAADIKPFFLKDFSIEHLENLKENNIENQNTLKYPKNNSNTENSKNVPEFSSFLLQVVSNVEDDLFSKNEKQKSDGILSDALNYLYKDVYRISL
ncbi:uncharacterized protein LOC112904110 isoform X2 [Agrilus planipennis]|nr:uncharacterized protein LOC112904110 isoform X2 [Agrilus planipennis]